MRIFFVATGAACLALACANTVAPGAEAAQTETRPPAPPMEPGAPGRHGVQAPFVLRVDAPRNVAPGTTVPVEVRIERRVIDETPLVLVLELPVGVELVEGLVSEEIVDGEVESFERRFLVRVDDPNATMGVRASLGGAGFGASATRSHHFGSRPEASRELPRPGMPVRAR